MKKDIISLGTRGREDNRRIKLANSCRIAKEAQRLMTTARRSELFEVEIAVQPGFRKTAPILGAYIELLSGENLAGRDFGATQSDL